MLDRQYNNIAWICDGCDDVLDAKTDDFEEARAILATEGWRTTKNKKEWEHYCPKCWSKI